VRRYLFIGTGGIVGAIARAYIKNIHIYHYKEVVPLNTLIINVTGCFVLSLILTIAFEVWKIDEDIRLGIATGFVGAYTTFSTLCKEAVNLIFGGFYYSALSYVTMSIMLGLAAVYFGVVLAREFISKLAGRKNNDKDDSTLA
jgi:fluoride exporter